MIWPALYYITAPDVSGPFLLRPWPRGPRPRRPQAGRQAEAPGTPAPGQVHVVQHGQTSCSSPSPGRAAYGRSSASWRWISAISVRGCRTQAPARACPAWPRSPRPAERQGHARGPRLSCRPHSLQWECSSMGCTEAGVARPNEPAGTRFHRGRPATYADPQPGNRRVRGLRSAL